MKVLVFIAIAACLPLQAQTAQPNHELGYTDTPILPGLPWHVHDPSRPRPPIVGSTIVTTPPPSDAVILFDGHDLSAWQQQSEGKPPTGQPAQWKVENGYIEVASGKAAIGTKEKFGDMQLHLEWASPTPVKGDSQGRGNSGVFLMGLYEIQVLDAWQNPTYADGQAGAVYGQWPPLANPAHKPGEWNSYDIVFEAPRLEGDKVIEPAYVTVIFNGVVVQDHRSIMGPTKHRELAHYAAQPAEDSLVLQNHNNPVRYRNIWARKLTSRPE